MNVINEKRDAMMKLCIKRTFVMIIGTTKPKGRIKEYLIVSGCRHLDEECAEIVDFRYSVWVSAGV